MPEADRSGGAAGMDFESGKKQAWRLVRLAVGWSGRKFQYWLLSEVNSSGAVSPAARETASSAAVAIPPSAVRSTM